MVSKSKKIMIALIVIIILLIGLNVLMLTGVIGKNESCSSEIVKQKSSVDNLQIIKYYKNMLLDYSNARHEYSVVDINNDNIPELLIYTHGTVGNSIIANINVYSYDEKLGQELDNYVVFVGILNGRVDNDTILYKMNDGKLLSVTGKQGLETLSYYSLNNDWLVRESFSSGKTEEYTTGDKEITFIPCTDTSLLDEYK